MSLQITVYELQTKLQYELERAAARAAQQQAMVQHLTHNAALTSEEVARLQGMLYDLERK